MDRVLLVFICFQEMLQKSLCSTSNTSSGTDSCGGVVMSRAFSVTSDKSTFAAFTTNFIITPISIDFVINSH